MEIDFVSSVHKQTKRDYLGRVNGMPKAEAAKLAKQWGKDYWDGSRETGYGGYKNDGRWKSVAEKIVKHYNFSPGCEILDVGCGKGFLVEELCNLGMDAWGFDISEYAIENSSDKIRDKLFMGKAEDYRCDENRFELVISINCLHNLKCFDLYDALKMMTYISKRQYVCVESYRNEEEKVNLLYWQLTCQSFYSPEEWVWWFDRTGYYGDHSFVFFD